ncbi:unnamed protein product, partial [Heligmosomoides polygyrus]|uniref:ELM2 domain-containing protein n=1 Tax=Heligmosomoides polygyrus TaxID=6339 RepID=A0A183FWE1_HELPZ
SWVQIARHDAGSVRGHKCIREPPVEDIASASEDKENMVEDQFEKRKQAMQLERKPEEKPDPAERSWEVAVILRPHTVKYPNGSKEKEYMVIWKDWPWNDCWSLAPDCFDDGDKKLAAADTRERLISQMASYMQMKDRKSFEELFPKFHKRHDYTTALFRFAQIAINSSDHYAQDLEHGCCKYAEFCVYRTIGLLRSEIRGGEWWGAIAAVLKIP